MTDAINPTILSVSAHQQYALQGDGKLASMEASALDPETRSRLLQLGRLVRTAWSAASTQVALSRQLADDGLGTLGPPHTDVLNDPVALEELSRKKHKERELATGLRKALDDSTRTQADLLRAFSFLLPQITQEIMPGDEPEIGLPGFQSPMQNPADMDASGLVWNSHADFFAQISALLEVLKTEWLSKYQDALAKFLEFYKEFSDIMEDLRPEADGDKGDVKINFREVYLKLKTLMADYGLDKNALASFTSEAAAKAFKDSLGLPGLNVSGPGTDGLYRVKMDLSAVQDIMTSMENPNLPGFTPPSSVKMDSAQYNAWISSKDSNMEQIKHISKVLGEKLNEMTQKYDNIVKILSSSIDKMSEANNAYVNNT